MRPEECRVCKGVGWVVPEPNARQEPHWRRCQRCYGFGVNLAALAADLGLKRKPKPA